MTARLGVVVIDDHRMFADALGLLLAGEDDIDVLGTCTSAEEALELCQRVRPNVVLMDMDLPGMDGVEATRRLRELHPDVRVVVITAFHELDTIAQAVEAGAIGYVPKTRAADDLVRVIRLAAAGEMVLPTGEIRPILARLEHAAQLRARARRSETRLTDREVQVLKEVAEGKATEEVAEALQISAATVQSHMKNILTKLGVRSKLQAVLLAMRLGLVPAPQEPNAPGSDRGRGLPPSRA